MNLRYKMDGILPPPAGFFLVINQQIQKVNVKGQVIQQQEGQ